jgi:hypothetical protein
MKRLLCFGAFVLLLAVGVGLILMFAVQALAEPFAAQFLRTAHLHVKSPVLPVSTVLQLSHYVGVAGFLMVVAEAIHAPSTPARRHR